MNNQILKPRPIQHWEFYSKMSFGQSLFIPCTMFFPSQQHYKPSCMVPGSVQGRVMLCIDLQKCFLLFLLAQTILILISIYGGQLSLGGMDDINRL